VHFQIDPSPCLA